MAVRSRGRIHAQQPFRRVEAEERRLAVAHCEGAREGVDVPRGHLGKHGERVSITRKTVDTLKSMENNTELQSIQNTTIELKTVAHPRLDSQSWAAEFVLLGSPRRY